MPVKAFLFDMNGTMIDDMQYHIKAWHDILNRLGANIDMEQMKAQCYGKNEELLERIFPGRFTADEMKTMVWEKETAYQQVYRPSLKLIEGLHIFMDKARNKGIKLSIGSAAIMYNIDFVLDGLTLRNYFDAIVSADDVTMSKPHPETFLKCAAMLHVSPAECIVFEDAPKGVEAASNAGMSCVVLTTMHAQHEFSQYNNIRCFIDDYRDEKLHTLLNW